CFGYTPGKVMQANRAYQFAFHEDAKTITVGRFVETIDKSLLHDRVQQAVCVERLVTEPENSLQILAGIASAILDAVQQIHDVSGKRRHRSLCTGCLPCRKTLPMTSHAVPS